jgi:hypothetical protein
MGFVALEKMKVKDFDERRRKDDYSYCSHSNEE